MLSVNGEFDAATTESRTAGIVGNNPRGSREIPESSGFSELYRSETRCCFPISAGLAPAGSQPASYNERIELSRSP